ncbi:MAG: ACP S-malonyltransferase [Symbiobacteriia bacterium]
MGKTAFLFPGQGAQYVGMGRSLAESYPVARAAFAEADDALDFPLSRLCFEGPEESLVLTENQQPALLATSVACLRVLQQEGITCDAAAGLSLGEYTALVAAGALAYADAVRLVRRRGRYMQEAVPAGQGAMAALLGLSREVVEDICRRAQAVAWVQPANYNCPGQIVVAGEAAGVDRVLELAREAGSRRAVRLPVSAPFHSRLMAPAGERLAPDLAAVKVSDPAFPVVANVSAEPVATAAAIRQALVAQVSSPVLFEDSVRYLLTAGVDRFIEVGPGKALSGFVRKVSREVRTDNVEDVASLGSLLETPGRVC